MQVTYPFCPVIVSRVEEGPSAYQLMMVWKLQRPGIVVGTLVGYGTNMIRGSSLLHFFQSQLFGSRPDTPSLLLISVKVHLFKDGLAQGDLHFQLY
jgi:hypothetical protein